MRPLTVPRLLSVGVVLALIFGAAPAAAATLPPGAKKIGQASASGDFAIATANGDATDPASLWIKVTTSRQQSVSVFWIVTCSRGFSSVGSSSSNFTARSPAVRRLKIPLSNADACTVVASGSISQGGRVVVRLFVKR